MRSSGSLKSLHTKLIDAQNGYEQAVKDADDSELKAQFGRMRTLHGRAHEDVHAILLESGEHPNESGSFMSLVHETVIAVRSAVTGLDHASLENFADGEERNVSAYDKAIDDLRDKAWAADNLQQHKGELIEMIARMKTASHGFKRA